LIRAALSAKRAWVAASVLVLLLTAFISLIGHLNRMLYGDAPDGVQVGERGGWPVLALAASAAVLVVLGVTLPMPLAMLIQRSADALLP
jgi:hypothetical protein